MHAFQKQSHLWNWALSRLHYIQQIVFKWLITSSSKQQYTLRSVDLFEVRLSCVSPLPVGQVCSLYLCLLHIIRVLQLRIAKKDEVAAPQTGWATRGTRLAVSLPSPPFKRLSRVIHTGGYHITLGSWVGWVGEKFKWYRHYFRFDQPVVIRAKKITFWLRLICWKQLHFTVPAITNL